MGKGKRISSEEYVQEAIVNIRDDRAIASTLLIDLMKVLKEDTTKHQYSGPVAAKYLETLQRSNEQLVKLASLIAKKEGADSSLSSLDKSEIYDLINEEK
jgi:hypothetical protein